MSEASANWEVFAPVALVVTGALFALVLDALVEMRRHGAPEANPPSRRGPVLALVSTAALVAAGISAWSSLTGSVEPSFDARSGVFIIDRLTSVGTLILTAAALLTLWLSVTAIPTSRLEHAPFHALVLLASAGLYVAIGASHLALLYVGLELASVSTALLAAYDARRAVSHEAGFKLHVAQGFATALMLFGMALLYGATGELSYAGLWAGLDGTDWLGMAGLGLLLCGLFFKLGLVPFHQWVADVFEGAPAAVAGFLAVSMPVGAVIVLLRLLDEAIPPGFAPTTELLRALAVASIVVGHGLALAAQSVRRMLACAGIAQAGHMTLGLACASVEAFEAVLFYAFVYAFIAIGLHGLVASIARSGRPLETVDEFAGLAKSRPLTAMALSLFLLSLAGLPGTAGFWAVFNLLSAATAEGAVLGVGVALVGLAVSWRYLLAIPYAMVARPAPVGAVHGLSTSEIAVFGLCALVVLYLGWQPAPGLADVMSGFVG